MFRTVNGTVWHETHVFQTGRGFVEVHWRPLYLDVIRRQKQSLQRNKIRGGGLPQFYTTWTWLVLLYFAGIKV